MNFSHPVELAGVIGAWLDGALLGDDARLPDGVRVVHLGSPSGRDSGDAG